MFNDSRRDINRPSPPLDSPPVDARHTLHTRGRRDKQAHIMFPGGLGWQCATSHRRARQSDDLAAAGRLQAMPLTKHAPRRTVGHSIVSNFIDRHRWSERTSSARLGPQTTRMETDTNWTVASLRLARSLAPNSHDTGEPKTISQVSQPANMHTTNFYRSVYRRFGKQLHEHKLHWG